MMARSIPLRANPDTVVANWLFICCAMVFAMVVLGGVTRLTGSGLSMVEWRPVYGILPPLGEAEWNALFSRYQETPEFRKVNFWMTVGDFKSIFWLEYVHRVWGRLIGIVFLLPYLYFLVSGRLGRGTAWRLAALFALGAAQGFLGWYMVRSGLVERPDVSQYRLTAHLFLALVIYGYMFWLALGLRTGAPVAGATSDPLLAALSWVAVAWVLVVALSGALVAGIDAGLAFNSFPLMEGRIVPPGYWALGPIGLFENAATVQFNHRILAILLTLFLIGLWSRSLQSRFDPEVRLALALLAAMAVLQAGLGVTALLSGVATAAAASHQAGALILFTLALWSTHALARAGPGT